MDINSYIIVLCGGISGEREVSLRSGKNVHQALKNLGYSNAKIFDYKDYNSLSELIQFKQKQEFDFALLMTHGNYGEDGCIQGFLELLQVPYSGSDWTTSAICMNKTRTKEILAANKLPVLETYLARDLFDSKHKILGPIILKPISGGSSVGIEKFNSQAEFINAVHQGEFLEQHLDSFFAERFVTGTELTTSVIAIESTAGMDLTHSAYHSYRGNFLLSLPLLELRPKKEFYDYEAKYTEGMTEFILPAKIDIELEEQIHNYAIKVYEIMEARDAIRVDFIIEKTNSKPYILEVNTLPGMTNTSDLPAQAKAAGIDYDKLVEKLL